MSHAVEAIFDELFESRNGVFVGGVTEAHAHGAALELARRIVRQAFWVIVPWNQLPIAGPDLQKRVLNERLVHEKWPAVRDCLRWIERCDGKPLVLQIKRECALARQKRRELTGLQLNQQLTSTDKAPQTDNPEPAQAVVPSNKPDKTTTAEEKESLWPPDDGWHFQPGRFAFRQRWYDLKGKPLALLERFVQARGVALTLDELKADVWAVDDRDPEETTIRTTISALRTKLKAVVQELNINDIADPLPRVDARAWRLDLPLK